jgi:hypothetical protein
MKTIYLTKSVLPLLLLPAAPGVLQFELVHEGFLTGVAALLAIVVQAVFTLATFGWIVRLLSRREQKAFLKMSCISKKVFHSGKWMTVEQYLAEHHNIQVSHGMTPEESQAWIADAEAYLKREELELAFESTAA